MHGCRFVKDVRLLKCVILKGGKFRLFNVIFE